MDTTDTPPSTLDPEDWHAFEQVARDTLSAAIDALKRKPDGPVWQAPNTDLLADLSDGLPRSGIGPSETSSRLTQLLDYGVGNTHPRFFGWVHGAGSPGNMLAEITAAGLNANCGGRDHIAIHVERQVLSWIKGLFGFPDMASGLIISGTSMATIIAAKTARDAALDFASRANGIGAAKLTGYVSTQAHSCLDRAFDMLGLGTHALRKIPTDGAFCMDLDALKTQIAADRAAGYLPFFMAGTAGTVNTGAIDDLAAIAGIAEAENLWFHVDGAFGASLMLSTEDRTRLRGIDAADSLAFDFHKWMHVNYEAGCVLIRDGDKHRRAFANRPDYLAANGQALAAGEPWPVDYGPELSRSCRALKVWAHFLEHGSDKIGRAVRENCDQAAYLGRLVEAHEAFQLLTPVTLNICCFRYAPQDWPKDQLDQLNQALVTALQASGIAAPSTTRIKGQLAIRVNITNHRTRVYDLDLLVSAIEKLGRDVNV